jgi:hypothetical protein
MKRHELPPGHPVFGVEWKKLYDTDGLQAGDETACVSELLSMSIGTK